MGKYLYRTIADRILADIKSGNLLPGMNAPSCRELSDMYSASQVTTAHALLYLAKRGFLMHKPGKNYYVSHKLESQKSSYQFLTLLFRHVSTSGPEFYGNRIISGIIKEACTASIGTHFTPNASRQIYLRKYDFSKTLEDALVLPRQNNIGFIADFYIPDEILGEIALQTQLPVVVIGRASSLPNVHSVVLNAVPGYDFMLGTLKRLGYDAFICCESNENLRYEHEQQHQFFKKLEENESTVILPEINNYPHVQVSLLLMEAMEKLKGRRVAVMAYSDLLARQIIAILEEHNIKVPGQAGVVGFYGTRIATDYSPKLSCLSIQPEILGEMAAKLLISGDSRYQLHPVQMDFVFGETI